VAIEIAAIVLGFYMAEIAHFRRATRFIHRLRVPAVIFAALILVTFVAFGTVFGLLVGGSAYSLLQVRSVLVFIFSFFFAVVPAIASLVILWGTVALVVRMVQMSKLRNRLSQTLRLAGCCMLVVLSFWTLFILFGLTGVQLFFVWGDTGISLFPNLSVYQYVMVHYFCFTFATPLSVFSFIALLRPHDVKSSRTPKAEDAAPAVRDTARPSASTASSVARTRSIAEKPDLSESFENSAVELG
jgi:hypothetical protein